MGELTPQTRQCGSRRGRHPGQGTLRVVRVTHGQGEGVLRTPQVPAVQTHVCGVDDHTVDR